MSHSCLDFPVLHEHAGDVCKKGQTADNKVKDEDYNGKGVRNTFH